MILISCNHVLLLLYHLNARTHINMICLFPLRQGSMCPFPPKVCNHNFEQCLYYSVVVHMFYNVCQFILGMNKGVRM